MSKERSWDEDPNGPERDESRTGQLTKECWQEAPGVSKLDLDRGISKYLLRILKFHLTTLGGRETNNWTRKRGDRER